MRELRPLVKKIWTDQVGSKLIAGGILAGLGTEGVRAGWFRRFAEASGWAQFGMSAAAVIAVWLVYLLLTRPKPEPMVFLAEGEPEPDPTPEPVPPDDPNLAYGRFLARKAEHAERAKSQSSSPLGTEAIEILTTAYETSGLIQKLNESGAGGLTVSVGSQKMAEKSDRHRQNLYLIGIGELDDEGLLELFKSDALGGAIYRLSHRGLKRGMEHSTAKPAHVIAGLENELGLSLLQSMYDAPAQTLSLIRQIRLTKEEGVVWMFKVGNDYLFKKTEPEKERAHHQALTELEAKDFVQVLQKTGDFQSYKLTFKGQTTVRKIRFGSPPAGPAQPAP